MNKSYTIGIDPGKQTGFAIYDRRKQALHPDELKTTTFWGAYNRVNALHPGNFKVIIEVPDTKHVWQKPGKNPTRAAIQRQAVNVGGVIREAELLAVGLEAAGYEVLRVAPRGKTDAKKFQLITGWEGITNQHERDAALLCWGR